MISSVQYDVAVVGGGLAGLATAIQCARAGFSVILFEKQSYPFHRVCGEYISEESRPFLQSLGLPFETIQPPEIRKLLLTSVKGSELLVPLVPGGFGVSRYMLDSKLAELAVSSGVQVMQNTKVIDVHFADGVMKIQTAGQIYSATLAAGCFGKRSSLDLKWKRAFVLNKANRLNNFIGIKYHVKADFPIDTISLHNFNFGYCGFSAIEDGLFCLCYLSSAINLVKSKNSISKMEEQVLMKNPHLQKLFRNAIKQWNEPLSISQVSFDEKPLLHDHILLTGDAAGMISPLCGNGMSMALHGSKILVQVAIPFLQGQISRQEMETNYKKLWKSVFARRLQAGRNIQRFFGNPVLSEILVNTGRRVPALSRFLVRQTHGEEF